MFQTAAVYYAQYWAPLTPSSFQSPQCSPNGLGSGSGLLDLLIKEEIHKGHCLLEIYTFGVFKSFITFLLLKAWLFWHYTHLQLSVHSTPSWKHSQYFLTQKLFRQEQPLTSLIYCLTALRSEVPLRSLVRWKLFSPEIPSWFSQFWQRQFLLQKLPSEKHSQYILVHLEFLQLQLFSSIGF